jgi:hypothetical protein
MCWAVYKDTTSGLSLDNFVDCYGAWAAGGEGGGVGVGGGGDRGAAWVRNLAREMDEEKRRYWLIKDAYFLRLEVSICVDLS